jgi:exopolyphosphatase / guanosine-5'-triphosphate,3'-diphosphate pyrophosphatase
VLIYQGVRQAVEMADEKHLILDIGGGSNELIIANDREIFWKESFPLGMARLLERFNPSDPIREDEILSIENYISRALTSAIEAAMIHNPAKLIGSSGTFDTFRALLQAMNNEDPAGGQIQDLL